MTITEQWGLLDGFDVPAERMHGTGEILNQPGRELERSAANAE